MGEKLQVGTSGVETGPVRGMKGALTTTFMVGDPKGDRATPHQLMAHNRLELLRPREPKASNPAELEEFITIEYSTRLFKIRGNRAALDKIQSLGRRGELDHIEASSGVDPEKAEELSEPVVYSVELIEKGAKKPADSSQQKVHDGGNRPGFVPKPQPSGRN